MSYIVADVETELLRTRLSLSIEQQKNVDNIYQEYIQMRKELCTKRASSQKEYIQDVEELEKSKNQKLKMVLDEIQWEIYQGKNNDFKS